MDILDINHYKIYLAVFRVHQLHIYMHTADLYNLPSNYQTENIGITGQFKENGSYLGNSSVHLYTEPTDPIMDFWNLFSNFQMWNDEHALVK